MEASSLVFELFFQAGCTEGLGAKGWATRAGADDREVNARFDELDGTWTIAKQRMSLPGAIWLPEVGRGRLAEGIGAYLETRLSERAARRAVVVFCTADCWMSWNAARRVADLGYETWWWPLGVDGWTDAGRELAPVTPVPVDVD